MMFLSFAVGLCIFANFARSAPTGKSNQGPNAYAMLTMGQEEGGVSFIYDPNENCMRISGTIRGLAQGYHGFHIHTFGDLRKGCKSASGHFNPDNVDHAGPGDSSHHVGDLGNIISDSHGVAKVDMCFQFVHTTGDDSVIGRSVVIHAGMDDLGTGGNRGSLRTGNAGARVVCGIIGLVQ